MYVPALGTEVRAMREGTDLTAAQSATRIGGSSAGISRLGSRRVVKQAGVMKNEVPDKS
jgi:hypothetical protein